MSVFLSNLSSPPLLFFFLGVVAVAVRSDLEIPAQVAKALSLYLLFAIGFIFTFIHGGLTGLFLGNVTIDLPLSDTYFVVAHFHMVMGVSPVLVVFGAIYHWWPKITGKMYNETLGKWHFWMTFLGTYAIYLPMHYLGILGVPRRYYALGNTEFMPESVHTINAAITIAASTGSGSGARTVANGRKQRTATPVTAPARRVRAPACRFRELRENEPPTGKPPDTAEARLAAPWLTSSWFASQR